MTVPTSVGETHTFARKLPQEGKNLFVASLAEFAGTFLFLFFALGGTTAVNNAGPQDSILAADPSQLLYICMCFGFSLAVTVWMFFRVSGGLFNPVVTLSLVAVGAVNSLRGIFVCVAQILGGISAAAVLSALLPGDLQASTTLRDDTSIVRGLFIEMFATSLLVLSILLMAVEKHRATFTAPLCIGLSLFVAELMSIPYTGGGVNPARSFGPCVATRSFPGYHWIYWLGPILGSLLATGFYKMIKFLEYETCNPGQDGCGSSDQIFKLHHEGSPSLRSNTTSPQQSKNNSNKLNGHCQSGSDVSHNRSHLEGRLSGDTRVGPDHRNSTAISPGIQPTFNVNDNTFCHASNLEAGSSNTRV
ncbi:Aquaporin-1 [Sporothrix epigloea]|uniref:Aquaporin-1 n=1 Tax=Sporothrix epigloea TaxID=1892477 RepID=A0ABP0DTQ0_9PEZI